MIITNGCLFYGVILLLAVKECHSLTGLEVVNRFFAYFKEDPPKGIPIMEASEPFDVYYSILATPVTINNGKIYGHSQLIIDTFFVDFTLFKGEISTFVPQLRFTGDYDWGGLFSSTHGDLECVATDVKINLNFTMKMMEDDILHIVDVEQKVFRNDLQLNMTNLKWVQQTIVDSGVFHLFYQQIADEMLRQNKPFFLKLLNREMTTFANSLPKIYKPFKDDKIQYPFQLPSGSAEKQSLIYLVRRTFQYAGLEPLHPPSSSVSILGIKVHVKDLEMTGISNINDIETFRIEYMDKKIYVTTKLLFARIRSTFRTETFLLFYTEVQEELVNLHGAQVTLKMVLDIQKPFPIIDSKFDFKAEWVGNLARYSRDGKFFELMTKIEKVFQAQLVNILEGILEPAIQKMLRKVNLEEMALQLLETK